MSRTPQVIGNAKRQGLLQNAGMAVTIGVNDEIGGQDEILTGIAAEAIVPGDILVRSSSDMRNLLKAHANAGITSLPCGVALDTAGTGFPVRFLRRGIHAGVKMNAAGGQGNQITVSVNPGLGDFNAFSLAVAPGLVIGMMLETASGSPLRASAWINCPGI